MKLGGKILDFLTGGILDKVLDKVVMDKETKAKIKADYQASLLDHESEFRDFVLEQTGKMEDLSPSLQWLRGSVRPVITYCAFFLLVFLMYAFVYETTPDNFHVAMKLVFSVNVITLVFWFGDRVLQKSGLLDVFNGKKK